MELNREREERMGSGYIPEKRGGGTFLGEFAGAQGYRCFVSRFTGGWRDG